MNGVNVNALDVTGQTAMHIAAKRGHSLMVCSAVVCAPAGQNGRMGVWLPGLLLPLVQPAPPLTR